MPVIHSVSCPNALSMEKDIAFRSSVGYRKDFSMHSHYLRHRLESGFFFHPTSIFRKVVSSLAIWLFAFSTLPAYPATMSDLVQPAVAMHRAVLPQPEPIAPKQVAQSAQAAGSPLLKKEVGQLTALKKPAIVALQASSTIGVFVGYADSSGPSLNFPTPWKDSPNIVFLGGGTPVNAGAI